jgi:hypothetical protein
MHYDTPTQELLDLINSTREKYHSELHANNVTVDAVLAYNDKAEYPVKQGGYPVLAFTKISSLKNRVKGFADAEITIDGSAWESLNDAQKEALIDRELHSLTLVYDKEGALKTDDANRPKIRLKKYSYRLSWFTEIAKRHKQNSPEVYQAKILWDNDSEVFFPDYGTSITVH